LIDATLTSFRGNYCADAATGLPMQLDCHTDPVIIRFPDRDCARAWYGSVGYRSIRSMRNAGSHAEIVFRDAEYECKRLPGRRLIRIQPEVNHEH
jgi:uncharacterized protein (DUF1330 family)